MKGPEGPRGQNDNIHGLGVVLLFKIPHTKTRVFFVSARSFDLIAPTRVWMSVDHFHRHAIRE